MKKLLLITASLLLAANSLCGQTATTAAPGRAPASAPAASGPNQAAANFLTAVRSGDLSAIVATMSVDAADKPLLAPILDLAVASAKLQAAMEKKFGEAALAKSKTPSIIASPQSIKEALTVPVKIDGDKATLTVASLAGAPQEMVLRKIGSDWKLDAAATFKMITPDQRAAMKNAAPQFARVIQAIEDTRGEVEKGSHGTPDSAIQALQKRLLEIGRE